MAALAKVFVTLSVAAWQFLVGRSSNDHII
jgi:hypothetical protein